MESYVPYFCFLHSWFHPNPMSISLCSLFSSLDTPATFVVECYFSGSGGSIYQIYHQIWEEGVRLGSRARGVLEGIIGWGAISADTITQNLPLYPWVTARNTLHCIHYNRFWHKRLSNLQCQCQCRCKTSHYTRGSLHAICCAASMDPLL